MNRFLVPFILLIAITSCKKFEGVSVYMKNGNLFFSNKEMISICVGGLFVTDFGIEYTGDSVSKSAWTIVRENKPSIKDKSFDFPLQYGERKSGMITRSPAIKVRPGDYSFGGTILCIKVDGKTGFDIAGKFEIKNDGSLKPK